MADPVPLISHPLSRARLNQLLTLAHEAPVSQPLFSYYWLSAPEHPYDVCNVPYYHERWLDSKNTALAAAVQSLLDNY